MKLNSAATFLSIFLSATVVAEQTLVLDFESDDGAMMYLAHNIPVFPFEGTASYSNHEGGNLSKRIDTPVLLNHLVVTGLISLNGEVIGMATEQEYIDREANDAKSAWLFILNHPKWKGTFAVEQREGDQGIGALRNKVMQTPDKQWSDEYQRFMQTIGEARISMASAGLEKFNGAKFVEYNFLNPADLKMLGRFRAKLQFEITFED